jgi:hypothetical protein
MRTPRSLTDEVVLLNSFTLGQFEVDLSGKDAEQTAFRPS